MPIQGLRDFETQTRVRMEATSTYLILFERE